MLKKHVFGSFILSNSQKYRLSFEDIVLGTLHSPVTNQTVTGSRLTGYIVKCDALSSNQKVDGLRLTGGTQSCYS